MEKLSFEKLKAYHNAMNEANEIATEFEKRISYICKFICKKMKMKYSSFNFAAIDYHTENNIINVLNELSGFDDIRDILIYPNPNGSKTSCFYVKINDREILIDWSSYQRKFPKRWLFEDFEEEFNIGYSKFLEKCKVKKFMTNENKIKSLQKQQEKLQKSSNKLKKEEIALSSKFNKNGPHQFYNENK